MFTSYQTLGLTTAMAAGLWWLMKLTIERYVDARLNHEDREHDSQLKQLERHFESRLRTVEQRDAVMFTHLHKKRVEAIEHLHYLLSSIWPNMLQTIQALIEGKDVFTRNEPMLATAKLLKELQVYLPSKELYFSKTQMALLDRMHSTMAEVNSQLPLASPTTKAEHWRTLLHKLELDVQPADEMLMAEFRKMLGVTDQ